MMRDPERIIQGHSGEDALRLMQSVSDDAPSARARARTLVVLGIPATVAVAGKATAATVLVATAKWLVAGAGVAVVALGVSRGIVNLSSPAKSDERTALSKWAQDKQENSQSKLIEPARPMETTPQGDLDNSVPPEASTSERVSNPAQTVTLMSEPVRVASRLAQEVAALDLARSAALAHEPTRVLKLLDAYQREFPRGALGPEAQVLRIEALAGSAQADKARALAQRFLIADPTGPLAERVRAAVPVAASRERNSKIVRSKQVAPVISQ
jgi:hypothetical protein